MNILYQGMEQVFVKNTWGFTPESILGVVMAILTIASFVAFVIGILNREPIAILCLLLVLWFGFLSGVCFHQKPVYKDVMTYQVTLDDTYSYNQLVEQYDIIETKGQILTIREKGWDNDIPKEGAPNG